MNDAKVLLFLGSKRSGSTMIMNVLNQHRNIHITYESDIIQALYEFYVKNIEPDKFEGNKRDGKNQIEILAKKYGKFFNKNKTPFETFLIIQYLIMNDGQPRLARPENKNLIWIGDKKYSSHIDHSEWVYREFPCVKFLHIVRNPFYHADSVLRFGESMMKYLGKNSSEIIKAWTFNEMLVLNLKNYKYPIHTIKYENFCEDPCNNISQIFDFLEVENTIDKNWLIKYVQPAIRSKVEKIEVEENTKFLMRKYKYL